MNGSERDSFGTQTYREKRTSDDAPTPFRHENKITSLSLLFLSCLQLTECGTSFLLLF